MYHTKVTAQGVASTFKHKILEVNSENGAINDVYHVSRAVLQPNTLHENLLAVKLYYNTGSESKNTVILFTEKFLLSILNEHNATSNYGGTIGRITMKITNDYE